VLFVGEAGSGKSTLARALHERSPRAGAPFVVVDCAALPEPVAAAEILEQALTTAEGGTILFAEPQELPFILQRELVPPLDARVFRAIATTTRDLRPLVNQGAFREALYFRLAGATVNVPPLRDRLDDLPLLFRHFLEDDAAMATPSVLDDLARLPWTGNVQEVRNYAARMRASGGPIAAFPEYDDEVDSVNDFGAEVATVEMPILDPATLAAFEGAAPPNDMRLPGGLEPWFVTGFKEFREKWIELGEREYLRRLMARTNRSSGTAAREAGLERTYLYRLIKKHGV
jgi:DNA-binding NtrC family response regulator